MEYGRDWTEGHANCEDLEAFVADIEQEASEGCNTTGASGPASKRPRTSLDGARSGMLQLVPFVGPSARTDDQAATILQQQQQQQQQQQAQHFLGLQSIEHLGIDSVSSGSISFSPGLQQPRDIATGTGFAAGSTHHPNRTTAGVINRSFHAGPHSRPMEASEGATGNLIAATSPQLSNHALPSPARAWVQGSASVPDVGSPYSPRPQQPRAQGRQASWHVGSPSHAPGEAQAQAQQGRGVHGQQQQEQQKGFMCERRHQQQHGARDSGRQEEGRWRGQPLQQVQQRAQVHRQQGGAQQQNKQQQQHQHQHQRQQAGASAPLPPSCTISQSTALVPYCPHPATPPPIPVVPPSSAASGGSRGRGQQHGGENAGVVAGSNATCSQGKGGHGSTRATYERQQQVQQQQQRQQQWHHAASNAGGTMRGGEWEQAELRGSEERRGAALALALVGGGETEVRAQPVQFAEGESNEQAGWRRQQQQQQRQQQQQQLMRCRVDGGSVERVQASGVQEYGCQGGGSQGACGPPLLLPPMAAMDHFLQLQRMAHQVSGQGRGRGRGRG